jgi:hypothetical protein
MRTGVTVCRGVAERGGGARVRMALNCIKWTLFAKRKRNNRTKAIATPHVAKNVEVDDVIVKSEPSNNWKWKAKSTLVTECRDTFSVLKVTPRAKRFCDFNPIEPKSFDRQPKAVGKRRGEWQRTGNNCVIIGRQSSDDRWAEVGLKLEMVDYANWSSHRIDDCRLGSAYNKRDCHRIDPSETGCQDNARRTDEITKWY